MLKIHVNYVEIIDDDSLWTKASFASFTGAHIRLSAANRVIPNLLINWVDRMFALNDIIWRNLQRADKKGVLSRVTFDEFVSFVSFQDPVKY